jgi:hypothetical protein
MKNEKYIPIIRAALAAGVAWMLLRRKADKPNSNNSNSTNNIGNKNLPRGYRNNNPLNIRLNSANNWQGKVANNTDGVFEQFVSMEYGYRAALKLLRNYVTKNGLNTVTQIINKWAPTNENNTSGYIQRVCNSTGWQPSKVIDPYNIHDMSDLVYAMALVENGTTILPDYTQIYKGWEML